MDLVAGAGGIFGQLAVGLAGGVVSEGLMPNGIRMANNKLGGGGNAGGGAFGGAKPTLDSLPDKVSQSRRCLMTFINVFSLK